MVAARPGAKTRAQAETRGSRRRSLAAGSHILHVAARQSILPLTQKTTGGRLRILTHEARPPSIRRHKTNGLPSVSRVAACALPRTGDQSSPAQSIDQKTARQPFRRRYAPGTTRKRTNESPLPCREHRLLPIAAPAAVADASTQATLPDYGV